MIKQADVAKRLKLDRSTVSLALRNDPRITLPVRQKVQQMARRLGYFHNPHLSSFMSEIRTGKKSPAKWNIAVLVDRRSLEEWLSATPNYRQYHEGMVARSRELGVPLDFLFMREPGMNLSSIDRILKSRGVKGVIMAAPYSERCPVPHGMENYACVGTGFGWARHGMEIVAWDHQHNVSLVFGKLLQLGYRRIGMSLEPRFASGNCGGTEWYDGFLRCQARLPREFRVPLLGLEHGPVLDSLPLFRVWYSRWKPEALVVVGEYERKLLTLMKIPVPGRLGVATLVRVPGQTCAGVGEGDFKTGRAVVDAVVARLFHGDYGNALSSRRTVIGGVWELGETVAPKPSTRKVFPPWVKAFIHWCGNA